MADWPEDEGEPSENGVSRRSPSQAEMFGEEPNAARPFAPAIRSTGRPKGSANRRTLAMRDVFLRMGYTHPMLWMGELLTRSVAELARELDCKLVEAVEIQRKVAADLAPYLESKMPTQLTSTGEGLPVLMVGEIVAARRSLGPAAPGAMAIDDDLADAVQRFQRLTPPKPREAHGEKAHDGAEGEQDQGDSAAPATD